MSGCRAHECSRKFIIQISVNECTGPANVRTMATLAAALAHTPFEGVDSPSFQISDLDGESFAWMSRACDSSAETVLNRIWNSNREPVTVNE